MYCDHLDVLSHRSNPPPSLGEKQAQVDLLQGESDGFHLQTGGGTRSWEERTQALPLLQERLNYRADILAKRVVLAGYVADKYIKNDLPFEQMRVKIAGAKVTGCV